MEMSRREKQADLRRRMAEARVRLAGAAQASSSSSLTQDDYEDDGNDRAEESSSSSSSSSAMQPPPPSSSQSHTHLPSAGGGGILKKSKYSASSSSSSTGIAAAAVSTNTPKLGVLMTGYANSSDEDENDITTNRVQIASHPPPIATSISTTEKKNDVGDKTKVIKNNNDETGTAEPLSILSSSSSAYKISDSVWDEFEALLEKDEEEIMSSLKVKGVNQMVDEDDITTLAATVVDRSDVKSREAKSTKKKRKRSRKEENNDELTKNNDQEDIEQVSYEARLARLMLLRGEKRRRGSSGKNGGENSSLSLSSSSLQLSSSMNEFYDSGLAFQHEGLDDDENEKVEIGDNENHVVDKNPRQDSYDATTKTAAPAGSGAMLSSSCPPSLADILREKRDEARKLSSTRGADDDSHINNVNTSDDIDCVSDGRWFF